jgi:phosphatidate cytidylyltransferase
VIIMVASIVIHPFVSGVLFLAVTILGMLEFYRLVQSEDTRPDLIAGLSGGILLYGLVFLNTAGFLGNDWLYLLLAIIPLIAVKELFTGSPRPFSNIAFTVTGIIYIALPLSLLNGYFSPWRFSHEPDFAFLLGFFIILWLNDTGAYLMGKAAGRHLLFPRISPKKTWEGIAGGLLAGILAAWGLSRFFTQLTLAGWIFMAVLIILFSTFGDLVESMMKRSVQVKDSGSLLPGHGGILDRFDGVLLASPIVYIYLYMLLNN